MALKTRFVNHRLILLQLMRFVVVGLSAATVHMTIVVALVESGFLQPLVANVVAFCFAFQISYWGNRFWTFGSTQQTHWIAYKRLLSVSILSFIANETLFYLLMTAFQLPYPVALFMVLAILPLAVFTANKLWVFE